MSSVKNVRRTVAVMALLAVSSAHAAPEHGKIVVTQNNGTNDTGIAASPAVSLNYISTTPGFLVDSDLNNQSRGDFPLNTSLTTSAGVLIATINQNGRDNTAFGEPVATQGLRYPQAMMDQFGGGPVGWSICMILRLAMSSMPMLPRRTSRTVSMSRLV